MLGIYLHVPFQTVIGHYIRNAIKEGEIAPEVACVKFAHTTQHGSIHGL